MLRTISILTGMLSFLVSRGQLPDVVTGKVERLENFPSRYVEPRNVDIWLPPGYSNKKKYAVLYMQDGQMLFDSSKTWNGQEWGVDETMRDLLKNKQIRETIVVGIWNAPERWQEYFPEKAYNALTKPWQDSILAGMKLKSTRPVSDNYLRFLVKELKPYVDSAYSTYRDKGNTFIAGSSMGGLISMYAVCEYPQVFGGAACLSTHWPGGFASGRTDNRIAAEAFNNYMKANLPSSLDHRFYFDYGTETVDKAYEPYQKMIDKTMTARNYNAGNWITLKFYGADHCENSWRKRLSGPLFFLLK